MHNTNSPLATGLPLAGLLQSLAFVSTSNPLRILSFFGNTGTHKRWPGNGHFDTSAQVRDQTLLGIHSFAECSLIKRFNLDTLESVVLYGREQCHWLLSAPVPIPVVGPRDSVLDAHLRRRGSSSVSTLHLTYKKQNFFQPTTRYATLSLPSAFSEVVTSWRDPNANIDTSVCRQGTVVILKIVFVRQVAISHGGGPSNCATFWRQF